MHARYAIRQLPGRLIVVAAAAVVAACASGPFGSGAQPDAATRIRWLDRVTWGANASAEREFERLGAQAWLQVQLTPPSKAAPRAAGSSDR